MTFARIWLLNSLWALPLMALVLIISARRKRRAMQALADPELLERLAGRLSRGRSLIKGVSLTAGFGLMLFSLAGPRWGTQYQEVRQKGVDIVIAVDVSPSMRVADVQPDRLERAKREIIDLLRVIQGDRVGLVAFSGAAFVLCPLTLDYGALQMFTGLLEPGLVPVAGTDLGAAIEAALSSFDDKSETDRVILLITDGEDNEGRGREAAKKAAERNAKIFVFGIGDPAGGPIPAEDGTGGFKKDQDGNLILSRLDEQGLRDTAALAGGAYVRSVAGDLDLDALYFSGIRTATKAETVKSGKIKVHEERFTYFLLAAFLLLVFEGILLERKTRDRWRVEGGRLRIIFAMLILMGLCAWTPSRAGAGGDPDELYLAGKFADAEKEYARLDMDDPKDIRHRYNRGCAAFQNGDFQSAAAAFSSVLKRSEDREIRFRAAYNLANTAFRQGDMESAVAMYRQAVRLKPESEDARYNLELALRELDRLKRQQEKPPENRPEDRQGDQRPQESPAGNEDRAEESQEEKDGREGEKGSEQESRTGKDDPKPDGSEKGREQPGEEGAEVGEQGDEGTQEQESLEGELSPIRPMDDQAAGGRENAEAASAMDRKRAEALLDNMQEDRSRMLRSQLPSGRKGGVRSGKDW